jgi:hypothetical protein
LPIPRSARFGETRGLRVYRVAIDTRRVGAQRRRIVPPAIAAAALASIRHVKQAAPNASITRNVRLG